MSISSKRGKDFELLVAKLIRKKLGARVSRDARSGAGLNKADMSDFYNELPLHIECKDQETVKIKEWFAQADATATVFHAPTVVFHADSEILATLRLSDLLNFLVEIADLRAEIADLRMPSLADIKVPSSKVPDIKKGDTVKISGFTGEDFNVRVDDVHEDRGTTSLRLERKMCRNDHLADQYGYCLYQGCKYSRGYRPPKGKKK